MSDLGNLLKKAREQKGYTLEDVQDITKIRRRYLEAIEDGDFKALPGNFYVRAFVKNYSEAVGLDSDEVLRLYAKDIPSPAAEPVPEQPIIRKRRASTQTSDRISKWGFRLLMWSFLILIGVVVYVYAINNKDDDQRKYVDNNSKITDEAEAPDTSASAPEVPDEQPEEPEPAPPEPEAPASVLAFVSRAGAIENFSISPAGTHKYEIKVLEGKSSWIEIRKDSNKGDILHYKTLTGPTELMYELDGPIYLNIGFTPSVEIRIDGLLLEDGDKTTKKFLITPSVASAE